MNCTTAIALSGGIDSLVSAYLLKEQGRKVIGVHFITGYESDSAHLIENIGHALGISVELIDCSAEFQSEVVDYFIRTYLNGQTPNPCLVCNPSVKFGTVLSAAREQGASCLATGHYARIIKDTSGRFHLHRGTDLKKDQSYFLAFLSQDQLAQACFPIGNMTKDQVRKLAGEKKLYPAIKEESQDVCFIKGTTYGEFLTLHGAEPKPGSVVDVRGNVLGKHNGLHLFTVGQRRGINCPASEPYYVVRIDSAKNRLVVGFKKDMLSSECRVTGINWICKEPEFPVHNVLTRLRYRHSGALSTVYPAGRHTVVVRFEAPQTAITPGQGAVFYREDEVLGGGIITGGNHK
ncbi:tRNA 2-thiouridine(34) synthase MnmA [Desulfococcaceae bacterium HSG8]|nr:tRNA 2-thiouridine(34) synthase MnmA [Desulfococcaceae bacterium HSG8]